jgi:hypothetical protein
MFFDTVFAQHDYLNINISGALRSSFYNNCIHLKKPTRDGCDNYCWYSEYPNSFLEDIILDSDRVVVMNIIANRTFNKNKPFCVIKIDDNYFYSSKFIYLHNRGVVMYSENGEIKIVIRKKDLKIRGDVWDKNPETNRVICKAIRQLDLKKFEFKPFDETIL